MASNIVTADGKDLDSRYLGINAKAQSATTADSATNATNATNADNANYANNAGYANSAGSASPKSVGVKPIRLAINGTFPKDGIFLAVGIGESSTEASVDNCVVSITENNLYYTAVPVRAGQRYEYYGSSRCSAYLLPYK